MTPTVSKARNIPVGTDALSPDPKHDIYSIEDMPAEVWLWLLYRTYCGIKITGSNYTRYVAAGMWSNFVVDYLLIDAGTGGSGNYHGDSAHVGWPDAFRTILHTHHALMGERVDLDGSGETVPIRDGNGAVYGAAGGTRLLASGGLRGELDMLKVLIAGADGLVEGTIGKAAAFGCTQCGNCHLDCPRGGITTKQELTVQNDRGLMRRRMRNWTALNMVKLAVLVDALNRESGALDEAGAVARPDLLLDDIRLLRGRTDLLEMPVWPAADEADEPSAVPAADHDSCRVGSLAVSEPVTVEAIWEAARRSFNGGNNRGGGIDFAGFAPPAVRDLTAVMLNVIGPDRRETLPAMLAHFAGCRFVDAAGTELDVGDVLARARRARRAGARALPRPRGLASRRPARRPRRLRPVLRRRAARGAGPLRASPAVERALAAARDQVRGRGRRRRWRRRSRSSRRAASPAARRVASPVASRATQLWRPASWPTCARSTSACSPTCSTRATTARTTTRAVPRRPASTRPNAAATSSRWVRTSAP